MKRLLVFGLSGQLGSALLENPSVRAFQIIAPSRHTQSEREGVYWLSGSLQAMPTLPSDIDAVLSLGPLDAFAEWFSASDLRSVRVVALGSSGVISKINSSDSFERSLADRLASAEAKLCQAAANRDSALTLLRPTLIYGTNQDRSLTPLINLARRWRFLPLPFGEGGLRQPVHVHDVAQAIFDCLENPLSYGGVFDLPGGEIVSMKSMVCRTVARYAPNTFVFFVPIEVLSLAAKIVVSTMSLWPRSFVPALRSISGFLARWHQSQLFDAGPAQQAFGYKSRGFVP